MYQFYVITSCLSNDGNIIISDEHRAGKDKHILFTVPVTNTTLFQGKSCLKENPVYRVSADQYMIDINLWTVSTAFNKTRTRPIIRLKSDQQSAN